MLNLSTASNLSRLVVLVLILIVQQVPALSQIGEGCNETASCEFGYCDHGKCVYPKIVDRTIGAPCNKTADCVEGYCDLTNHCILPLGGENIIGLGVKNGCSGIITCPIERVECFIFCNLIWALLIILSFIAAYSNRRRRNKLAPIIALLLPFAVALISVPTAGLLIAVFEITASYYLGKERKSEYEE